MISTAWRDVTSLQAFQAAGAALNTVTLLVLTRRLGPTEYGRLALYMSMLQLLFALANNWTIAGLVRFAAEEWTRDGTVRRAATGRAALALPCLALALGAALALRPLLLSFTGLRPGDFWFLPAIMVAVFVAEHGTALLQASRRVRTAGFLQTMERALYLGAVVVQVVMGPLTVRKVLGAALASRLAHAAATMLHLGRDPLGVAVDRRLVRALWAYSWPIFGISGFGYLTLFLEPYLLRGFFSTREVGIYQAAFQGVTLIATTCLTPLATALLPFLVRLRAEGREGVLKAFVARTVPLAGVLFGMAMAVAVLVAAPATRVVFGAAFAETVWPLRILLVATALQLLVVLLSPVLSACDETRAMFAATLTGTVVFLLGLMALIPAAGVRGAAANWIIWYAFMAAAYLRHLRRRLGTGGVAAFFGAVAPVVALAVSVATEHPGVHGAALVLLLGGTVAATRYGGLIEAQDIRVLAEAAPPRARPWVARFLRFVAGPAAG